MPGLSADSSHLIVWGEARASVLNQNFSSDMAVWPGLRTPDSERKFAGVPMSPSPLIR